MALNTTLGELLIRLREECGHSVNPAQGQNTATHHKRLLQRTQTFLWQDFAWEHLKVWREEQLFAGQRYYTFEDDLDFERIEEVWIQYSGVWTPIQSGIPLHLYNSSNPDDGEREDPVRRWQKYEGNQYEVWPVPESNDTKLKMRGVRKLRPFVADADQCDIDDELIILFASAEVLARQKSPDAQLKLDLATKRFGRMKAAGQKSEMFIMGGGMPSKHHYPRLVGGRVRDNE
jgi:hypothetical protein